MTTGKRFKSGDKVSVDGLVVKVTGNDGSRYRVFVKDPMTGNMYLDWYSNEYFEKKGIRYKSW